MPTIPMLEPAQHADAWHQVTAPGGYEWWYFDAEDSAQDLQVVAILFEGFVFHPGYLREYDRYLRRPTHHRPPLPGDYPCAYFAIYRDGRVLHQFMTQYPVGAFKGRRHEVNVELGPNRLSRGAGGEHQLELSGRPWELTWQGPRTRESELRASLAFTPLLQHPPTERAFFSRKLAGADHQWVLADPLCDVSGEITLGDTRIPFRGRGYHDHNYGTGPIGPGLKRWIWGRVLGDDSVLTFHHATALDGPPETHLLYADPRSVRELRVTHVDDVNSRRTGIGLAYPTGLTIVAEHPQTGRDDAVLTLSDERVVDLSPFYMRLTANAASNAGVWGKAFCEVAYPHRLRWPILGRMIEMSIDQRSDP